MIDYKKLRRINPEAARQAVLDYLASAGGNIAATARAFGITRIVVYDILARARAGNLADQDRAPRRRPNQTPPELENRIIAARNRTGLGYERLSRYLAERGVYVPWSTIRNVLKRNRHRLDPPSRLRQRAEATVKRLKQDKRPPVGAMLERFRSYR
jgi:transposase